MAFTPPTLDETTDLLTRDYKNRFPGDELGKTSDNWKRLRVTALAVTSLHRHLQVIDRDCMPDTATGDRLDRWGTIYDIARKGATPAKKANALRCTGTLAAALTIGDALTSTSGLRFQVNETTTIPAALFVDLDIIGVDVGSATRLLAGEILTFTAPPAGIDASATLVLALDEDGEDRESDGSYRARILDKIAQPEMGGNAQDFRAWAKEVTGIAEAYVWPLRGGLGSVHLAALKTGQGSSRLLTAPEVASLQTYIDAKRPVGYEDFLALTVLEDQEEIGLRIQVLDDAAFNFDWDDSLGWTVSAWTAGTRTLKLNAARPADMQVGDRITYVHIGPPFNNGSEYVIEAFGAAADEIVLALAPVQGASELVSIPPTAGDAVYSGGPVVSKVRTAVLNFVNNMGPGRADTFLPNTDYSEGGSYWEGTLRKAKLEALAFLVKGVKDAVISVPAANYSPINVSPNASVYLITPGQFTVRKF